MEQSHLIELIKTLQPEEKEQILPFAALSNFSKSKMKTYVGPLLEICLVHPWHEPEQILDKNTVSAAVFPGQPFVEGKLEKVMVEAHKVIRSFLIIQYYLREENEFQQVFDFAEIIRKRGLSARYRSYLSKLRKMQEDTLQKDAFYFHNQYLLEYAVHNEESLHNQIKGDLNIPKTLDALEMHLYLNRLALLNVYLLQQKAANIDVSDAMRERLADAYVPQQYLDHSPAIKINHTISTILKKEKQEAKDARQLFDLLLLHEKNLDTESIRSFYTYLRNICTLIVTLEPDQKEIYDTLYELYRDNLERGYLHYEGKLHPSRYLAISEYAARVNKHEWALSFIEKFKDDIFGDNETHDIYRLNKALYFFGIGQFSECLDHIPATSPYVTYMLFGKRLELKSLYELQSDLLPYKIDAFKMFLSRTSQKLLPDASRQKHLDFINLLYQLVSTNPGDPKRVKRLVERMEEKKQAAEHRWLLAKAKQLIKGHS